jgi:nicotinamidase-related amidase
VSTASPVPPPATMVPAFVDEWFRTLPSPALTEVVARAGPAATALFSTDMTIGFCDHGNLASPRVAALKRPVADLARRLFALDVRQMVLLQDTHDPNTPEFAAWPPHGIRGTAEAETITELRQLPFFDLFTVIEKNALNPAIATTFDPWLDDHPELRTAIVAGNCTDLCVYQLAMHLRMRANALNIASIEVVVPIDVVDTYDLPTPGSGAFAHPADFFHRVFLYHLALNGVRVVRALT